jgi:hypothetical protein
MLLTVTRNPDHLLFTIDYNAKLFKTTSIETMAATLREVINAVIQDNHLLIKDIVIANELVAAHQPVIDDEAGDFIL